MEIEISFDDGHELDQKAIQILEEYDLKGLFYIPINSWGFENINKYHAHEIGCHTWSHPVDMKRLSTLELSHEVIDAKMALIGKGIKPTKFCFPRGRYSEFVAEYVRTAGFAEARTTKVLSTLDNDDFLKDTAIHFYDRKEYEGGDWLKLAWQMIELNFPKLRFWGHSWELEENDEWDKFSELCKIINESRNGKSK